MSLKIRLARGGAKKRPYYSIVVADSRSPRDGRFIEKLGTYNPMLDRSHADRVTLKAERIQHWLGVGALPTDRRCRETGKSGLLTDPISHLRRLSFQRSMWIPRRKSDFLYVLFQERLDSAELLILHHMHKFMSDQPAIILAVFDHNTVSESHSNRSVCDQFRLYGEVF